MRVLRALLRGARVDDPGVRQRVHVRLRDARRAASAWIIGWDLILEYGVSVAAVAVGWGGYLQSLLDSLFGISLPDAIARRRARAARSTCRRSSSSLGVTALLVYGVRESARANTVMVVLKLAILVFFIVVGVTAFNGDNFTPFAPRTASSGVVDAAALIFFAYIGFDAVSTSGEEARDPPARPADRDHRLAADRDGALHPRRDRRGRPRAGRRRSRAPTPR